MITFTTYAVVGIITWAILERLNPCNEACKGKGGKGGGSKK